MFIFPLYFFFINGYQLLCKKKGLYCFLGYYNLPGQKKNAANFQGKFDPNA